MRSKIVALFVAGVAVAAVSPAVAAGGCGGGFHRGPHGGCRANGGSIVAPVVVAPAVPRIGVYYGGRGYWDGQRYWKHRERWHGGWRYR